MSKQKKNKSRYSKIKNKIIENIVLVTLFLFSLFIFYLVVTKYQRMEKFEKESKLLKVCAVLENKYLTQGNKWDGGNRPPRQITVFKIDELRCKYYPEEREWGEFNVDQKYIIQGRATKTHCKLDKILGRC